MVVHDGDRRRDAADLDGRVPRRIRQLQLGGLERRLRAERDLRERLGRRLGVQKVELSIRRLSNGRYWNGTGFNSTTELWFVATGTTSWRYGLTASSLAAGSYTVRVRATDNSANVSTPSSTTFVYDNTNPSSTVTFPVANASYTTATWNAGCAVSGVCGTASDATSGVKRVEVSIRRGSTTYWNGTSFSSTAEIFLPATGTTSWSFAFPASNFPAAANYRIRVRATDNAGNVQSPSTRTITFSP